MVNFLGRIPCHTCGMHIILTLFFCFFSTTAQDIQDEFELKGDGIDSLVYRKISVFNALKNDRQTSDSLRAYASLSLGETYAKLHHVDLALEELNTSLNYFFKEVDSVGASLALLAISGAYSSVHEYSKALPFAVESMQYAPDSDLYGEIYRRLGYIYLNLHEYDSSEKYLNITVEVFLEKGNSLGGPLVNLGTVKLLQGDREKALEIFLQAEASGLEGSSITSRYYIYNFISALHFLGGNKTEGSVYQDKRDALLLGPDVLKRNLDFHETNFLVDTLRGDFEGAIEHQLKYIQILKSTYTNDLVAELANYQKLYELHHKESEIKILEQENELYRLKQNQSAFYLVILILGLALFFLMAIIFFRATVIRSRGNRELTDLNHRIMSQASDIGKKNEQLEVALQNLKDTQHHLIQSEKMASVGTFVSGMAHELNNPMNVLTGGLQMVEQSLTEIVAESGYENHELVQDTKMLLNQSNHSIGRVNRIIQALMMATQSQRSTVLDVSEIIENVELTFRPYWPKEVNLQMYLQKVKVECFPGRVHHAIRAILENAVYYALHSSNNQKYVSITLKNGEDRAEIYIKNNGPNIPQSDLIRVFDPFYTTKEDMESPGLGLYFAFGTVTDHQGILIASNEGQEVVFTMHLPFSQSQAGLSL